MTPEERTDKLMHDLKSYGHRFPDDGSMRQALLFAIRHATLEERERSAKIAESFERDMCGCYDDPPPLLQVQIAAKIREG